MREAIEDRNLLGSMFDGPSWDVWKALLIASRGEPLTQAELALYTARTGRETAPSEPVDEAAFIAGRRSGKTVAAATLAVYLAALCDYSDALKRGERGVLLFLAQSQRTARVAFNYASGLFDEVPLLRNLVANKNRETIELTNGVDLEIRPASFRGLRGMTAVGVIADELAFWFSDDSANPDTEILAAVRPALATTGGPLTMISSPYAKNGELYETYKRDFGPEGDPRILVAQGSSRDFNQTLSQAVVDRALERDPERFAAEYLGLFRTDISSFISREAVAACVEAGVRERAPQRQYSYTAFVDPSGGVSDSMTLAIAHKEGDTPILDVVREIRPPFSPEATVQEFAALLKSYRISSVVGDKYAGEWCQEPFRRSGIFYESNARPKSDLYRDLLPLINSRGCDLLDHDRLLNQLVGLERRVGRGGKDSIDHPPSGHDDIANAVAGVLTVAAAGAGYNPQHERAWRQAWKPRRVA